MNTSIFRSLLIGIIIACAVLFGGCEKKSLPASPSTQSSDATPPVDACTLLTGAEIQEVEGSPVKETKSSSNSNGGLRVSQCFYSVAEFAKSVSLAVTQPDNASSNRRSAKSYWHETFGRYDSKPEEKEGDEEKRESLKKQAGEHEEEEAAPPKKIDGLGDAAYWTGNRVGGALYILHNDAFIRVSVGGSDPEDKKIEKCKALAEKALKRM